MSLEEPAPSSVCVGDSAVAGPPAERERGSSAPADTPSSASLPGGLRAWPARSSIGGAAPGPARPSALVPPGPPARLAPAPSRRLLCGPCFGSLTLLRAPLCARCGAPTAWPVTRCVECSGRRLAFTSARAGVAYTGGARRLVHAWKERGLRPVAALAAELVVEVVPAPAADVITYIPPDGDRSLKRGHQPAAALARELAAYWQLDAAPLLDRTRPIGRQTGLTRVERRRNVRGAFVGSGEALGGARRTVVLVDDVYTTGATAAAAASALRAAGARTVHVVTFARAIR
jgi:predicted amidophosphoribosyltransferase